MTRIFQLTCIFLLLIGRGLPQQHSSVGSKNDFGKEQTPLLVLFEFGGWSKISADMPEFVLYSDGTVIYNGAKDPAAFGYDMAKLSPDETAQLMQKIEANKFDSYDDNYSIPPEVAVSDLPSPFVMLRHTNGTYKTIGLYGFLSDKAERKFRVQNIPESLRNTFYFLRSYEHPQSQPLRTEFVEVIIWKYDGESKKNIKWKKKLPNLGDSRTIAFTIGGEPSYSLFVPASQEKELAEVVYKIQKSRGALLLNGQRWNLEYRFPFPSERIWLGVDDGKIFRDGK